MATKKHVHVYHCISKPYYCMLSLLMEKYGISSEEIVRYGFLMKEIENDPELQEKYKWGEDALALSKKAEENQPSIKNEIEKTETDPKNGIGSFVKEEELKKPQPREMEQEQLQKNEWNWVLTRQRAKEIVKGHLELLRSMGHITLKEMSQMEETGYNLLDLNELSSCADLCFAPL